MSDDADSLVEESIKLELNIGDLYLLFYNLFPDDEEIWGRLTLEEKDHASILQISKEYFKLADIFPTELFHSSLQNLKNMNVELLSLMETYKETSPSREEAFNTALRLENSAGELEFQQFMNEKTNSTIYNTFTKLNKFNKEHTALIRSYMDKNGIPSKPSGHGRSS